MVLFMPAMACGSEIPPYDPPSQVPAAPNMGSVNQPDGTVINIFLKGDEWCNWTETESGYTIAKSSDDCWYYVAEKNGEGAETLKLTNVKAHEAPPHGLPKHVRPPCINDKK